MVQYWKNSTMMGVVSAKEAYEIMENSKNAGFKVVDYMPDYFVIITEEQKKKTRKERIKHIESILEMNTVETGKF